MGPFVIHKVARLYDQRVTIEDPDGPEWKRDVGMPTCSLHASYLAPFDCAL